MTLTKLLVLCQKAFMKIWIFLTQWFSRKIYQKYFPYKQFQKLWPYPRGLCFLQTWFCTRSESFHVNLSFSFPAVLEKNIFRIFFPIYTHVKMVFPIVAPSDLRGPWLEQTWIYIISGNFHVNWAFLAQWFLRRRFFQWLYQFLHFCTSPLKRT
jgi:hypothetical protein